MKWPFSQRGKAQAAAFLTFQTWSWEADSATVSALRVAGSWGTSQYEKMDAHGSTERLLVHSKRFYDECTDFSLWKSFRGNQRDYSHFFAFNLKPSPIKLRAFTLDLHSRV